MGRIVVVNHLTLDGVMQSPSGLDEDTRGGFEYGGWAAPNVDEVLGRKLGVGMAQGGALLFGRRTYEHFYGYWPHQTDNPFTPVLNRSRKYVVSSTLEEPLPWEHSTLLRELDAVAKVREQVDGNITVLGSGVLIQSLLEHGLIDELKLMIHPVVLGTGRRMFNGGPRLPLRLVETVTATTGVVMAIYRAED
jgi:dihydrofolate reductase